MQHLFAQLTSQPVNPTPGLIPPFYTDCGKNIHIGEHVFINTGCTMQDQGGIYIGDGALIGHHTMIATLNHDFDPEKRQELHPEPVHIGKNAWLGANVTVLPGVTIGDGAVIAAGAVPPMKRFPSLQVDVLQGGKYTDSPSDIVVKLHLPQTS